ncbi:hypothetical protein L1987_81508 [Smallanthus sonchifolius]|uniref:Uncharacterized protein n=1 Tax=Smallanthus sonchifolius TaxID=185202 RepID=A0ACB8YUV8_9ASTR|nr:hypothetical protein L1987_81508 [Smallanthus sonchifolius]
MAERGDGSEEGDGGIGIGPSMSIKERASYLVWQDLRVMLPSSGDGPTKRLLHGLNGFVEPGRLMAIMGPSGSGKSTLLDALAGRLSKNAVMTGKILVNGEKKNLSYGTVAYVTQEDVLMGTLSVRETITYSAHLRLPSKLTKEEVEDTIEGTIMEMGLEDCADRLIGNWHLRGISDGEKKRLSIALEILVKPRILFLDEPTSGLDSASAFFVAHALRSLARDGRTVISSIHQPSSEVFALFDDLFLLSGGSTVYFGESKEVIEEGREQSDPFMNLATAEIKATLGVMMMTSGFFRQLPDLPKPFWRYPVSYLNYGSWAIQGGYKNDLLNLVFDGLLPRDPKITGEEVITKLYRLPLSHSKWWDLFAIYSLLVSYRTIFFLILKLKERAMPFFRSMYAKRTIHRLKRRASFVNFVSSRRYQTLRSLASQEGQSSPIP